jgi:4-carboxymuconolactone decarboxylase
MTTHDDHSRRANGMKVRRRVLGDAWVDRAQSRLNTFNAEFQDMIARNAWGEVWVRPGLDPKLRSVIVLATTIAQGAWDEYRLHLRGAINNGLTPEEIKELIMQAAVYGGFPKANHAMKEAEALYQELGVTFEKVTPKS